MTAETREDAPDAAADPAAEQTVVSAGGMPHYTRTWRFDPYHQRLSFARSRAPEEAAIDTEWPVWEVFQQVKRGEHHRHVGSVHAPDAEIALVLAKENFARRGECVNLWVVPTEHIHATAYEDEDVFAHTTDKSYREPAGYHGLRKSKILGRERDLDAGHVDAVLRSADEVHRDLDAGASDD